MTVPEWVVCTLYAISLLALVAFFSLVVLAGTCIIYAIGHSTVVYLDCSFNTEEINGTGKWNSWLIIGHGFDYSCLYIQVIINPFWLPT